MTDKTNGAKAEAEIPENEQTQEEFDIAAELSALGDTISKAVKKAWNSEERQKIEQDVRDGLKKFASEVEDAAKKVRDSDVGAKVSGGVKQVRDDFESGKVRDDMRRGTVEALRSLRDALDTMAESFSEAEEAPEE